MALRKFLIVVVLALVGWLGVVLSSPAQIENVRLESRVDRLESELSRVRSQLTRLEAQTGHANRVPAPDPDGLLNEPSLEAQLAHVQRKCILLRSHYGLSDYRLTRRTAKPTVA